MTTNIRTFNWLGHFLSYDIADNPNDIILLFVFVRFYAICVTFFHVFLKKK